MSELSTPVLDLNEALRLMDDLDDEGVSQVVSRSNEAQVRRLQDAASLPECYEAQYALALRYWAGNGVPRDDVEAFRLCSLAAKESPEAKYTLGYRYFYGEGVPQDYAAALKLLEEIPTDTINDEPNRLLLIGWMYENERGTDQDLVKAARCYKESAGAGNPEAQYRYACMLNAGEGVPQDLTGAFQFARESAENGCALGKGLLAAMLLYGIEEVSVDPDEDEAARLIQEAVEAGEPLGFFLLGYCYESGRGLGKIDFAQAAKNYKRAAEGGHPTAGERLHEMYRKGTAVPDESERPQEA